MTIQTVSIGTQAIDTEGAAATNAEDAPKGDIGPNSSDSVESRMPSAGARAVIPLPPRRY
jgi:hypothetical protein